MRRRGGEGAALAASEGRLRRGSSSGTIEPPQPSRLSRSPPRRSNSSSESGVSSPTRGSSDHRLHHVGGDGDVPAKGVARSRWANYWLRFVTTVAMVGLFISFCVSTRQLGITALVFALQFGMYRELVHVAIVEARERSMPGFSLFYFYWFACAAYYMYARTLQPFLTSALTETPVLRGASGLPKGWLGSGGKPSAAEAAAIAAAAAAKAAGPTILQIARSLLRVLVDRHVPLSFGLYCLGLVLFVISLRRRRNFRYQFAQLAYCHVALLVIVSQSTLLAANAFSGLLWVLLPTGMVIANDSFAYLAGFFFGRTPLIRLSPKKTVEGFVGGAFATIAFALIFTHLSQSVEVFGFKYLMLCPVESGLGTTLNTCDIGAIAGGIFIPRAPGSLPGLLGAASRALLPLSLSSTPCVSRAQLHACVMATFASFIAPFGGFLASGFKRAFRIKDFADVIPGHGGLTDRFDCQLLMGAFAYIYTHHLLRLGAEGFAGGVGVAHHFGVITGTLRPVDIAELIEQLQAHLHDLSVGAGA